MRWQGRMRKGWRRMRIWEEGEGLVLRECIDGYKYDSSRVLVRWAECSRVNGGSGQNLTTAVYLEGRG